MLNTEVFNLNTEVFNHDFLHASLCHCSSSLPSCFSAMPGCWDALCQKWGDFSPEVIFPQCSADSGRGQGGLNTTPSEQSPQLPTEHQTLNHTLTIIFC